MKKLALLPCLMFLPGTLAYAASEEFCTDYVLVAISQYWQSVDENCGFSGSRWSADYKGQYDWCVSAHQWVAENETATRNQLLTECRERPKPKNDSHSHSVSDLETTINDDKSDSDDRWHEQLLIAVSSNDVKELERLAEKGADIHFVTSDKKLIQTYGMSSQILTKDNPSSTSESATGQKNIQNKTLTNESGENSQVMASLKQPVVAKSETLLSYATNKGLADVGLWLLDKQKAELGEQKAKQIREDLLGRALIRAVKEKNQGKVVELLEKGAPVNYELEQNFGTPLYFAVKGNVTPIVKTLLKNGANPKYSTNAGVNLLNFALDNQVVLKLLLDSGADPNWNGESGNTSDYPLVQAVKQKNEQAVALLMEYGANADIYDYGVVYPLLQAIANKQTKIVKTLLEGGADPNVVYNSDSPGACTKESDNYTPLDAAQKGGDTIIIGLLNKLGAKSASELCKK